MKRISHRQVGPEERVERLPAAQDFFFFFWQGEDEADEVELHISGGMNQTGRLS